MITISRSSAIALIRQIVVPFKGGYTTDPEYELLNGGKWWLEGGCLDELDDAFARKWLHLATCDSLEEVPDEFLNELLDDFIFPPNEEGIVCSETISWLMNARHC
jgi:hypothetical protein